MPVAGIDIADRIAMAQTQELRSNLAEIGGAFLKLGCVSFGGPVAHLGYFRAELVERRRWLDDAAYADLVALCQFLPGPASSQVVFALGLQRGGWGGALLASLCFTLPSAVLMILFAYGVMALGNLGEAGWLHGLKLAAVGVVAQAVWGMGQKLCPDRTRITLALLAATVVLLAPTSAAQVAVIVAGAGAGWWFCRAGPGPELSTNDASGARRGRGWAAMALLGWAGLLLVLPWWVAATESRPLAVFDGFYRAGSLVFGGGHVVLPLLRAETVPTGWLGDEAFLAGYGAAQAVPGPLFTFAGYLGAVIHGGPHAWVGGLWALGAIFLPAWLLIGGALPFWQVLRQREWAQAGLRGANAAVVGVLLAALYQPVWSGTVDGVRDVAAVFVVFALLHVWRVPPWVVVLLSAGAGQWLW